MEVVSLTPGRFKQREDPPKTIRQEVGWDPEKDWTRWRRGKFLSPVPVIYPAVWQFTDWAIPVLAVFKEGILRQISYGFRIPRPMLCDAQVHLISCEWRIFVCSVIWWMSSRCCPLYGTETVVLTKFDSLFNNKDGPCLTGLNRHFLSPLVFFLKMEANLSSETL
jgi:hypothetical protein